MNNALTLNGIEISNLGLGCFVTTSVLKSRPNTSCECCKTSFTQVADLSLSCAVTKEGNLIICNECAISYKNEGVEVAIDNRPKRDLRKGKVLSILEDLEVCGM